MSFDGVTRLNFLRQLYQARNTASSSDVVRELQKIKNEITISNDEKIRDNAAITNATKSPYLPDQVFYSKEVVYNSLEETTWREVKTEAQTKTDIEDQYLESNKRKINII